jgi:aminoglycoside 6'-N-acetyltransferase I
MDLAGVTLLTNRFYPAMDFYKKNGFEEAGHVVFLYKVPE